MADERVITRDFDSRKTLSWTELLRTFLIALDPFKLLVAAAGILATSIGWWLLSAFFYGAWTEKDLSSSEGEINDRRNAYIKDGKDEVEAKNRATVDFNTDYNRFVLMRSLAGPGGTYRTMPWFEERGRNPFLLARSAVSEGPGERRAVVEWLFASQAPVLVEPLLKFLGPIYGLFNPASNFWVRLYLFFLIVWLLLVWAFFGGVITRMAIVQIAGKEGGGLRDAIKFVRSRYLSYLFSPIVPIALIFAVVLGCIIFGIFALIPLVGDIFVSGLFWWIPLGAGFVMALLVVGLVGYPLMYTTLSAEGSDTFDALSRSYNYVYESPWHYLWYGFISILYGAAVVFFVVFMTSLMAYLGKWGVSQTPLTQTFNRSPEYLFVYTPTSFGWRELMLQGSPVAIQPNPNHGRPMPDDPNKIDQRAYLPVNPQASEQFMSKYEFYNYAGAGMVAFWMTLLFMLMLGFSYSFFWTQASMIYLLMRKKVDEVEVDEIYTEDEDFEEPVAPPKLTTPAASSSIPVEAPTLRVPSPPTAPEPPSVPPPADTAPISFPAEEKPALPPPPEEKKP